MAGKINGQVYIQREWTDEALIADGFQSYYPVKRVTMMRMVQPDEAPKSIIYAGNISTAEAGYWIAYASGYKLKDTLDDYEPRPITPDRFARTYHLWDDPNWRLTVTQAHLQSMGCQPYYRVVGVWAKQLLSDVWIQNMENTEPLLAPRATWLCIGMEGELWSMTEVWFQTYYRLSEEKRLIRTRLSDQWGQ